MIKTLKDTVELMNSKDYKERFVAEYKQLTIRHKELINMINKWDEGKLNFEPTCPRKTYDLQLRVMEDYIAILRERAALEEIRLS